MTINQVRALATELKNKHYELLSWNISFNKRKKAFGVCNYIHREISLSVLLIPFMSDKAIKETIIHEIAHALTKGHDHDNVWRRTCIELGGTGDRVGGSNKFKDGENGRSEFHETSSKYTLTCPTCGCKSYINRMPKRSQSCGQHGDRCYNPTHKLILTQNY